MNGNSYQTFEYVPSSEPDNNSNQLLVVEDNGSYFTLNRQEQIVLQVPGVNEVLEGVNPCTAYDIPSQQFYVDNPAELIPSDQFILPEVSTNLFTQNFLLQQIPSLQVEQTQQNVVEPINDSQIQEPIEHCVINDTNEEINNYTEITLTDDQYKILEQKGWLLLESNEKIFVLDNLGLHDITNNDKLIEKLRDELQELISETNQECIEQISIENEPAIVNSAQITPYLNNNETNLELVVDATDSSQESSILYKQLTFNTKDIQPGQSILQKSQDNNNVVTKAIHRKPPAELKTYKNTSNKVKFKPKSPLTIKTNFILKDIPEKICLGKTPTGKNLIAKVVNYSKAVKDPAEAKEIEKNDDVKKKEKAIVKKPKVRKKSLFNKIPGNGLSESELEKLVQESIRSNTPHDYEERAALIEPVILQLLEVASFKPAITDRNLVVTKITRIESRSEVVLSETKPILVSGRMALLEGGRQLFIPLPYMLQNLLKQTGNKSSEPGQDGPPIDVIFTHIHIVETKREGAPVRNAITITKRNISAIETEKKTIVKYVCPSCASVFLTKEELNNHREKCVEPEGDLTIDTGHADNTFFVRSDQQNKRSYVCTLCKCEFPSLTGCQRHVKIHNQTETEGSESQSTLYKCNLCPSVYMYSSSLSKHILKEHIKK